MGNYYNLSVFFIPYTAIPKCSDLKINNFKADILAVQLYALLLPICPQVYHLLKFMLSEKID